MSSPEFSQAGVARQLFDFVVGRTGCPKRKSSTLLVKKKKKKENKKGDQLKIRAERKNEINPMEW